jgi:polar amino acid transport system substrate-binding protein
MAGDTPALQSRTCPPIQNPTLAYCTAAATQSERKLLAGDPIQSGSRTMSRSSGLRCLLAVAGLSIAAVSWADSITIRADPWLPYNGLGNKAPAGYMIDLAEKIARSNGHTIGYANMPWDDALAEVRKGTYDCVVGAARDDADDFMFPDASWGKSQNAFFGIAENPWRFNGMESLDSIRLAVIESYSYSDELDAYIEAHKTDGKVVTITGIRRATMSAVSQLVSRKADAFVEDVNVMQQTLNTMQMTDRMVNKGTLDELTDVYIACTPANPRGKQYAAMFSDGIVKLRTSGELKTILDAYGLKDWEGPDSIER